MNCFTLLLLLALTGFLHKAECKIHGKKQNLQEHQKHYSGLQRPYRVRWYIEKSALVVNWEHKSGSKGAPIGFYVQLQELMKDEQHGPPDYVQVKNSRKAKVYGLKPNAKYALKVIAFTEDEHKPSKRIYVKTKGLAFLEASNFDVSSITDTSAMFSWQHPPHNNVHDVQFKLSCKGVQQYVKNQGEMVDEVEFVHHISATSREKQTFIATDLMPNTRYNCSIQTVADDRASAPHDKLDFMTDSGNPNVPRAPKVTMTTPHAERFEDRNFLVSLFKTDDQYGPISHYTVHAVPVYGDPTSPRSVPYAPLFPYSQLLTKSVSLREAMMHPKEQPFIVGKYGSSALPNKLQFREPSWKKAFKHSAHYVFVVVAYTENKNELKYTLSEPSSPIYISSSMELQWMKHDKMARFLHIIVGTVVAFAVAGLLVLGALLILIYWRRKKKMKWILADSASDNSDTEAPSSLFKKFSIRRKRKKKLKEKIVDDNPRPKENLAEWAIKKFQRNPKFDAMVYRSPENIKEMEEQLQQNTLITQRSSKTGRPPSPGRLEEVKKTNSGMEEEGMPLLISANPQETSHPTSPLLRSKQSQNADHRRSSVGRYSTSSVAAAVVHDEYLRGSYTLPHTHPYETPAAYMTHKTTMPTTVAPRARAQSPSPPTSPTSPRPYMRVHDDIILN